MEHESTIVPSINLVSSLNSELVAIVAGIVSDISTGSA
jgi:hypothetical protein